MPPARPPPPLPPNGAVAGNSSIHRIARQAQLPRATTPEGILQTLGDHADEEYPIYGWVNSTVRKVNLITLATALFDLRKQVVTVFTGNPAAPSSRQMVYQASLV